jgi:hypothetical protein
MSKWQTIESAPRDGTNFLAYFPRHPLNDDDSMNTSVDLGGAIAVTWRAGNGWMEPDYLDAIGSWFGDDNCYADSPTHWQPLPPPPGADDEQ